jgi:purine-binding chemotaxis protein CheW
VIDVRLRFGLPAAEATLDTRIIVTESQSRVVALRVDSAREVLKLDSEKHQPAPAVIAERASGFVSAVHSLGNRLLLLVDLPKILGDKPHDQPPQLLTDGPKANAQLPS